MSFSTRLAWSRAVVAVLLADSDRDPNPLAVTRRAFQIALDHGLDRDLQTCLVRTAIAAYQVRQ
jgi:hypothetical protein